MGAPIPAGWYLDPAGSGRRRYFDGIRWGPFEPLTQPQPPARRFSVDWASHPAVWADGEYSSRSKVVAGLLQLFFGWHGLGRFYLGYYSVGAVQLTLGIVGIFGLILCYAGIIILVPLTIWVEIEAVMMMAGAIPDAEGHKLR